AAEAAFRDLRALGSRHPLLAGLSSITSSLAQHGRDFAERDVEIDNTVYEQRICFVPLPAGNVVRIYSHDVTARRQAEQTLHDVARRVVLAEERERRRVSRELHDEAGQALAALKISLQLLQSEKDLRQLRRGLDDAISLVEQTREQIKLLAQGLRPPALDALDLNAALEGFCEDFARRTDLHISYEGIRLLEPIDAVRICMYRFLQEALANTARHALAREVSVKLCTVDDEIWLEVHDDGRGMDLGELEREERTGLGLQGMRERIQLLSGALEVASRPGWGTTLIARLPLGGT
ncbi:MAG TPA: ATP-binding protein, partial [Acidimicrobiia bacterium]|nr:ATP-binding protein [Acidimicrobiia bacterium]